MTDPADPATTLRQKFWKALDASPFVMLERCGDTDSAAPMTALLDPAADSAIWFFTRRDGPFAPLGPALALFAAKGHDLFARFEGTLSEETSLERRDHFWSNVTEAWFPAGKDDPALLMVRMDLGEARLWDAELGLAASTKMMLGMDVRDATAGKTADTRL